ncbi:hypothetical protein MPNT_10406 [Candidatus Methylacidithermus pantelleriae]|uniref:Uncharacterized protein n=1 Tax=Candidatus Methylacidithermus pantelleriae TaxID=2744239 RepID=A0A8J2FRG0_9BACT|nr:hypothetical protein MPNT_10406 [Candidatus Methylacidithermus pantelleriae]
MLRLFNDFRVFQKIDPIPAHELSFQGDHARRAPCKLPIQRLVFADYQIHLSRLILNADRQTGVNAGPSTLGVFRATSPMVQVTDHIQNFSCDRYRLFVLLFLSVRAQSRYEEKENGTHHQDRFTHTFSLLPNGLILQAQKPTPPPLRSGSTHNQDTRSGASEM